MLPLRLFADTAFTATVAARFAVFTSAGSYRNPDAFVHGLRPALLTIAALAMLGALTGLATRRKAAGTA